MSTQEPLDFKGPPPDRLPRPARLSQVCGVSCGMPARHFFPLLRNADASALVDTRLVTEYRDARFAFGDDLSYLCREMGIQYLHLPELAPTVAMRETLHGVFEDKHSTREDRAIAWTRFLNAYTRMIVSERRVLREGSPLRDALYGAHDCVAFLCACQHHEDCHRQALLGVIGRFVEGVKVTHLSPETVGGSAPGRKSPRRYLRLPIEAAGLLPSAMPRGGNDASR